MALGHLAADRRGEGAGEAGALAEEPRDKAAHALLEAVVERVGGDEDRPDSARGRGGVEEDEAAVDLLTQFEVGEKAGERVLEVEFRGGGDAEMAEQDFDASLQFLVVSAGVLGAETVGEMGAEEAAQRGEASTAGLAPVDRGGAGEHGEGAGETVGLHHLAEKILSHPVDTGDEEGGEAADDLLHPMPQSVVDRVAGEEGAGR